MGLREMKQSLEPDVRCIVRIYKPLSALTRIRAQFGLFQGASLAPKLGRCWKFRNRPVEVLSVIVIGQTGYGKSSVLNTLIGEAVFERDDVEACTKVIQSADFYLKSGVIQTQLSFTDLPGVGESVAIDETYKEMYRKALVAADCVVYVLRADKRDYALDLELFDEMLRIFVAGGTLLVALNFVDRMPPVDPERPLFSSPTQLENLRRKIDDISNRFGAPGESVIPVSALTGYGVDQLAGRISGILQSQISSY